MWIASHYEGISDFYLESNFATDKKSSQVNILRTRGKRVVAEVTIPAALIKEHMRASGGELFRARQVSGVNNNGLQSANGIAALFIATGQDAANVAASLAALTFSELLPGGDYYTSITLPSLIVATYGGGTGLATQRNAWNCSAATGPGTCSSWPRSLRRLRCAANSHSEGRSSPENGSPRTTSLVATDPSHWKLLASSRPRACNSKGGSATRPCGGAR